VSRFRRHLLLSSLLGMLACGLLLAGSIWLVTAGILKPPLPFPAVTLLVVIVFGLFSLAEIPMMILVMRRLALERPENQSIVFGINALYVFFAAIYGVPVLLLTGSMGWALALCVLGLVRLATSLAFIHGP
jgi:hypothetical protein